MARRSDHTAEELRALIVQAAQALAMTGGAGAVNARDIAKAIGYAPGTIYNHFANLDDLVRHMNAATVARLAQALEAVIEPDPARRLHALADAYLAFVTANPLLWAAVFAPLPRAAEPPGDWYRATLERPIAPVRQALEALAPNVDEERRRLAVFAIWGALHGISTLVGDGAQVGRLRAAPAPELAHFLLDCVIAGLRQDPAA